MSDTYHLSEFDNVDDPPPNRENEERASRRLLLVMLGSGLTVGGLYFFGVFCGILGRGG
ncbi:hypothetical protein BSY16_3993 [Sinorhizobium sp. RAC02]|nr:hypothetical protein BSY16_3993 [Sinorhizobium sp. RAC02]